MVRHEVTVDWLDLLCCIGSFVVCALLIFIAVALRKTKK